MTTKTRVHFQLARWASSRGLVEWEQMCAVLTELGDADSSPLELWVERGLLCAEDLAQFEHGESLREVPGLEEDTRQWDGLAEDTHHWQRAEPAPGQEFDTMDPHLTTLVRNPRETGPRDAALRFGSGDIEHSLPELLHDENTLTNRRASLALAAPMDFCIARAHFPVAPHTPISGMPAVSGGALAHGEETSEAFTPFSGVHDRYVLGRELGRGGGGRVLRAYDRLLGRTVAMKIIHCSGPLPPQLLARFIAEAQTTGQLDHPNIMPIYDFGLLHTGEPFYTMREVRNNSLRAVLLRLRSGDPETCQEYTLVRLVEIVRQVCLAMHFAHARGVIHRDLKPDNIMIGDYGEVLVVDWGLARLLVPQEQIVFLGELSESGQTLGTPAYMPPEQARGQLDVVDELSDVYSIGAVLYEVLTLRPPFTGETPLDVMWRVIEEPLVPPHLAAAERDIPEQLEAICLRAMSRERHTRQESARQIYDALTGWIEGHQPRMARRSTEHGDRLRAEYHSCNQQGDQLYQRVLELRDSIEDWESVERKRELWQHEDQLREVRTRGARAFGQALSAYQTALVHDPDHARARAALMEMYVNRILLARRQRDSIADAYFTELLEQIDVQGEHVARLNEPAHITITSGVSDVEVQAWRLDSRERRLAASDLIPLGQTPVRVASLDAGRYLLRAERPGAPAVYKAIRVEPGQYIATHLDVPGASAYREGFVFVPGGTAMLGGDRYAVPPRPERAQFVPGFFCSVYPVTFGDYLEWIDALHETDPEEARRRAPCIRAADGMLAEYDAALGRWVPLEILIEGPARDRYPVGQGFDERLPVVGVSAHDAAAYAVWRGEQDGVRYRLPFAAELEKAGRSEDGRFFPWGDHFDATFCKMLFSRDEPSQLEPVGTFTTDRSPYGVRDLAGGVHEWCMREEEHQLEHPIHGGSWLRDQRACRMASMMREFGEARVGGCGFRLVYDWHTTLLL